MKIIRPGVFKNFPEIIVGISTKAGGVSPAPYFMNLSYKVGDAAENVKANRNLFFDALGIPADRVSYQKQTHSTISKYISSPIFSDDSDALYTNVKNNYLAVSIADCIPILLYEPEKKIISAVHSGWKGTCNKILTKNIMILKKEFNIDENFLYAYIGPGISQKNFQVGNDVAELFDEGVKIFKDEKYYVDLKKDNFLQLISSGVKENNIEVSDLCTFENSDLLHSYRRDKDKSGRMLAIIGMKNL